MNLEEARKLVENPPKSKANFMAIKVSYDCTLILPYADGVALMATLANAEMMEDNYGSKTLITPLLKDKITAKHFSRQDYERHKMAALLNISVSDLEKLEEEELQKTQLKEET